MEFLDEQRVQPCGHKAREKGMIIKVFTSCKSYEIPTEYRYSVCGTFNDKNTGVIGFCGGKQLMNKQTTVNLDCSKLRCGSKTIDEPCTLQSHHTWNKVSEGKRIRHIRGEDLDHPAWCYILLEDDDVIQRNYETEYKTCSWADLSKYGEILAEGFGEKPPNDIKDKINEEYLTRF